MASKEGSADDYSRLARPRASSAVPLHWSTPGAARIPRSRRVLGDDGCV